MAESAEPSITPVAERILELRGERVLLDADLAEIYGVETRVLNQAVKRNAARFPVDFAFRLTAAEAERLRVLRSQSVILKRGQHMKYPPWAFTEHGAIMAASVLNSTRAIEMSVFVVRAFVMLRDAARRHSALSRQLDELERRVSSHDADLKRLFVGLRLLLDSAAKPRRMIGFQPRKQE
jgi:hypothetical protein